jgi:hypothetical protein
MLNATRLPRRTGSTSAELGSRTRSLATRVRFPNGIRALVGLDLTFSVRGVAIRH